MTKFTVTGKMEKVNHGLVDFVADGIMNDEIECQIGFTQFDDEEEPTATHIFIADHYQGDTHYCADTIEL